MKKKILLPMLASALLFGQAFADDDMASMHDEHENVTYSTATSTLTIPKVSVEDASGTIVDMVSAQLVLINNTEPYEFRLVHLGPVAADTDDDLDSDNDSDDHGCVLPETWHEAMGHCMVQN